MRIVMVGRAATDLEKSLTAGGVATRTVVEAEGLSVAADDV